MHACRLRATDPSRHYVPCEGSQRKRDVLDPRNFNEGNVEVLRFADIVDKPGQHTTHDGEVPTGFGLAEPTAPNPARKLASAVDLTAWLDELPEQDQELLALRAEGYTLEETGNKTGISTSTVFGRCRRLGEELGERAGISIEVREPKEEEPSASSRPSSSVRKAVRRTDGRVASCAA